MDFLFTDTQIQMRDTMARFVDEQVKPVAAEMDRKYHPLPREIVFDWFEKVEPFGLLRAIVPEELGGLGLKPIEFGIVMEQFRRGHAALAGVIYASGSGAAAISRVATPEQFEKFVKPAMEGKIIVGTGITEPDTGSNANAMKTRAVRDGDEYVITGAKSWISNGTIADYIVVVCNRDEGDGEMKRSRIIVETDREGFSASLIPKMGLRCYSSGALSLDEVRVPVGNLISEDAGMESTYLFLNSARTGAAISAVGVAQAALDLAIEYAKERVQFGRPIAKFQLIQDHIAEMTMELDAARLLTYRAMLEIERNPSCFKECSIAKAYATEAAVRITSRAMQVMGAYGISEEFEAERYFRDARCFTYPDGTTEIQKLIIGRETLGMGAFV